MQDCIVAERHAPIACQLPEIPSYKCANRRLFLAQVFDTNGSLLFAFETRDPHDPTSPRREASLFDSPGLLARRLFWTITIPHVPAAFGCIRPLGRSAAVTEAPQV